MIIPIRAPTHSESAEKVEWVMLELNGELLKPLDQSLQASRATSSLPRGTNDNDNDIRRRVELGSVKLDDEGAPTLIIGNHELKGTAIKLKEPFAVLRKRKACQITEDNDANISSESKLTKNSRVQLEVAGIVKKKLMFDQYPKSIMR